MKRYKVRATRTIVEEFQGSVETDLDPESREFEELVEQQFTVDFPDASLFETDEDFDVTEVCDEEFKS